MPIIGKDISLLTQKASVAGTEKLPVSDTEYITPAQIRLGNAKLFYGTCATAAGTAVKAVVCPAFVSAELIRGAMVFVTFDYTNSATSADLKLNVNSTGEYPLRAIYRNNAPNALQQNGMLQEDVTYLFVFNGAAWVLITSDYSISTPSVIGESEAQTGTATTARCVSAASLKRDIEYRVAQAGYLKYHECEDEAEYEGIQNKDAGTLYLIPESS